MAFFRWLGSPRMTCAPMVLQSELPFRMLVRKHGAHLCYTPMIRAREFVRADEKRRREMFTTIPEDRPLVVQFCANTPEDLLAAAELVQDYCDAVDLNLGCPQSGAEREHFGAFLLEEPELVQRMVRLCAERLRVPIFCKVRLRQTFEDSLSFCRGLVDAGCQLITVHGRRRQQRHHEGPADWPAIRALKAALPVPIISNGSCQTLAEIEECLKYTKADGVMCATGLLANPGLFSPHFQSAAFAPAYCNTSQLATMLPSTQAAAAAAPTANEHCAAGTAESAQSAAGNDARIVETACVPADPMFHPDAPASKRRAAARNTNPVYDMRAVLAEGEQRVVAAAEEHASVSHSQPCRYVWTARERYGASEAHATLPAWLLHNHSELVARQPSGVFYPDYASTKYTPCAETGRFSDDTLAALVAAKHAFQKRSDYGVAVDIPAFHWCLEYLHACEVYPPEQHKRMIEDHLLTLLEPVAKRRHIDIWTTMTIKKMQHIRQYRALVCVLAHRLGVALPADLLPVWTLNQIKWNRAPWEPQPEPKGAGGAAALAPAPAAASAVPMVDSVVDLVIDSAPPVAPLP